MKLFNYCILLLSAVSFAQASGIDERRHIEVSGTAKIMVEPDMAEWTISMRGAAGSIDEASVQLENTVNGLLKGLKGSGFKPSMLKLSAISSGRHYEGHGNKRIFKGFYASRTAVVTLKDLSKRQKLEKVLLKDDKVNVSGMTAKSSKHAEWRRKSLLKAASNAKEKATELAGILGSEVSVVLSIRENSDNVSQFNIASNTISRMSGSESIDIEKLTYDAKVFVKFALK